MHVCVCVYCAGFRLAILALTNHAYCFNSTRLRGNIRTNIRQLELLGYRVVVVSHISHVPYLLQWLSTHPYSTYPFSYQRV